MIRFPVFHRLWVENYLLYPGSNKDQILEISFKKGPTLIAGVNGLGKSTLVTLMLRLLTGPADIPKAGQDGDLAEVEPEPIDLDARPIFSARVADGAKNARATLELSVGNDRLVITRSLSDLKLTQYTGPEGGTRDEREYQNSITSLVGLGSFYDVLLVLRYVVFFLEDRRALVWGKTAQREILRALFLEPKMASDLSKLRYDMLSTDSGYRNLRNVLRRRIRENSEEISKLSKISDVRSELSLRETELESIRQDEDRLTALVDREDEARQTARLRAAKGGLERDSAARELERAKVHWLRSKFESAGESGLYVFARLLTENHCLVCDTEHPGLGQFVADRIESDSCPLCGSSTPHQHEDQTFNLTAKRIEQLQHTIQLCEEETRSAQNEMQRASSAHAQALEDQVRVTKQRIRTSEQIRQLRIRLPSSDRTANDLEKQNDELQKLIDAEEAAYKSKRSAFERALRRSERLVAKSHKSVADAFSKYAAVFLKERCTIAFQPIGVKIGQTGAEFKVGLFQLSMTGAAVGGETPRTEPDQVSMSQREFLDLAFRMALIRVASGNRSATIVVDAPDSSLDFLFARRAGDQLAKFASEGGRPGNRVIATTNLANIDMIPAFLAGRPKGERAEERVVDLLKLAAPNRAVRDDGKAYATVLRELLSKRIK